MTPPTTTAQMHKIAVKNGKPRVYDPPEVKEMKATLLAHLAPHRPGEPLTGPVQHGSLAACTRRKTETTTGDQTDGRDET